WTAATTPPRDADKSDLVRALADDLTPALDRSQPVRLEAPDPTGGIEAAWTLWALAARLEHEGYEVTTHDASITGHRPTGSEQQVVRIHHVEPGTPPPEPGTPTAERDDIQVWVNR